MRKLTVHLFPSGQFKLSIGFVTAYSQARGLQWGEGQPMPLAKWQKIIDEDGGLRIKLHATRELAIMARFPVRTKRKAKP